jgi:UPF0716 family protein affecting phage T7 exclusion
MGLFKTVALVVVSGAAGAMIAAHATPKLITTAKIPVQHTGAVNTGVTAGSAALVFVLLSSAL